MQGALGRNDLRAKLIVAFTTLLLLVVARSAAAGAPDAAPRSWHYQLLPDSYLIDDCPPCARPTIMEPLRGTFDLRLVEENPLFSSYAMENIAFSAGPFAGRTYRIAGTGSYRVGGEVALLQDTALHVRIDDGVSNCLCFRPILPDLVFDDRTASATESFYRLRQWQARI